MPRWTFLIADPQWNSPLFYIEPQPGLRHYPPHTVKAMNVNCQVQPTLRPHLNFTWRFVGARFLHSLACLLAGGAFVVGCAHAPITPPSGLGNPVEFNFPFERVWEAIAGEALSIDPKSRFDLAAGTAETGSLPVTQPPFPFSEYALNPSSSDKHWSNSTYAVNFLVSPIAPDRVKVDVTCVFFRFNSSDSAWRRWPSTGQMEQGILTRLHDRLPAKAN